MLGLLFMYMPVLTVYVCLCSTCVPLARSQKWASDTPPKLELQAVKNRRKDGDNHPEPRRQVVCAVDGRAGEVTPAPWWIPEDCE